jgi:hypothetical protein
LLNLIKSKLTRLGFFLIISTGTHFSSLFGFGIFRKQTNLTMQNYEPTMVEILEKLKAKGYTEDFNITGPALECKSKSICILPSEFEVDEVFRFEGQTNPSDEAILYAVSSGKHNLKGVVINSYGVYSDEMTDEMMKKLS